MLLAVACRGDEPPSALAGERSPAPTSGMADVGGYRLAYACEGDGSPTVLLEAGLGSPGTADFADLLDGVAELGTRACTYDRAGTGTSDPRPTGEGLPTARTEADELHALLAAIDVGPPYVLVPHSYGGLVARVFADAFAGEVAGFVFEDVSTAWEIDLWPRWDPSPWIDGQQKIDIQTSGRQVLDAAPLGDRPAIVVSQSTYDEEGIPKWAAPIFARQQSKLAALGDDVIHIRAEDTGHFIHRERPELMLEAIAEVVRAVRDGSPLEPCDAVFDGPDVTCVSG
jgi:pimeloyl-ACP methyl ester carboxylesterase